MRRGLFGLISTAAIIATAAVGCTTGGGGSEDYDLPDIPGSDPTAKVMEFSLADYGPKDKALLMVVNAGKDEKDVWGREVEYSVTYKTPTELAKHEVEFNNASSKDETGARLTDDSGDVSVDYLCGYCESVEKFDALVRPGVDPDPSIVDPVAPHWDGKAVGTVAELYPPSVVSPTATSDDKIKVVKVLSDDETVKCNLLAQCNPEGQPVVSTEICKEIANSFGVGGSSIYGAVTKAFGNEWQYSPQGGLDGDTRVNIVICDAAFMRGHGGAVRFCDCFKRSNVYTSNEGEYIFISTDLLVKEDGSWKTGVDQLLRGVLAHQLTHLIEMNNKVIREGAFTDFRLGETSARKAVETAGLSEGYAQLASDICGAGVAGAQDPHKGANAEALDDINLYLGGDSYFEDRSSDSSLVFPQSLFSREQGNYSQGILGSSHMFMLYMLKNFGLTTIGNMVQSSKIGTANVTKYAKVNADQIFSKYCRSVLLSQYAGLPESDSFEYVKVNDINYVAAEGAISMASLPPYSALYTRDVKAGGDKFYMAPWTAKIVGFRGGKDADKSLVVDVEYPALGNVYMWRMNNDGSYSSEIIGVEKQPHRDR